MKPLYIIIGIVVLAVIAWLVFGGKKATVATDGTGDTSTTGGNMFGVNFGKTFGANWILTNNANGWNSINSPLLRPGGISKQ